MFQPMTIERLTFWESLLGQSENDVLFETLESREALNKKIYPIIHPSSTLVGFQKPFKERQHRLGLQEALRLLKLRISCQ